MENKLLVAKYQVDVKNYDISIVEDGIKIGFKGNEIFHNIKNGVVIENKDNKLSFMYPSNEEKKYAHTYIALIKNAIQGLAKPFQKEIGVVGRGFNITLQKDELMFNIGLSHSVRSQIPNGINVALKEKSKTNIILTSYNKQTLGDYVADIQAIYPIHVFSGRGIHVITNVPFVKKKFVKK